MSHFARILISCLLIPVAASGADLKAIAGRAPDVMLLPVYHAYELSPCQYYGTPSGDSEKVGQSGATILNLQDPKSPAADSEADSAAHFREYCRMKYAEIAKLNTAWGTQYAGFEDVEVPKSPGVDIRWADWTDYLFRATADRLVSLYQAVLAGDATRLSLVPTQGDIYRELAAARLGMIPEIAVSVSDGFVAAGNLLSADSLNSLGKPVSLNYRASDTPGAVRRYAYESLGSGAWFLGLPQGQDAETKKVLSEIEQLEPYLQHMYPIKPRLGIYVSRYTWALDGFDSGLVDLHAGLVERHVPRSFVYDDSDWSGYPILMSLGNRIIGSSAARKLRSYVESGGTLMIVGKFAELSDALKPFEKPILAEKVRVMKVPGLDGWVAKIGKGMAIWLVDDPSIALAGRVASVMEDLDFTSPTKLESADEGSVSNVEAFTLTDGLNFMQVLVNTSGEQTVCRATLNAELLDSKAGYHLRDSISGKYFGRYTGDMVAYAMELGPHAVAAVLVMYDATAPEAEKAVAASDAAARNWKGFGAQYALTYHEAAKKALADGKHAKAVAMASRVVSALGISATASNADGLQITARVLDSAGKPVGDASVRAVLTPALGHVVKLSHVGGGKYTAKVGIESLPRMYDYKEHRYVPFSGPLVIDITAERGNSTGAVRISVP